MGSARVRGKGEVGGAGGGAARARGALTQHQEALAVQWPGVRVWTTKIADGGRSVAAEGVKGMCGRRRAKEPWAAARAPAKKLISDPSGPASPACLPAATKPTAVRRCSVCLAISLLPAIPTELSAPGQPPMTAALAVPPLPTPP